MPLGDPADDSQTCARAFNLSAHRPLKQLEDPLNMFGVDARSPVAYHETYFGLIVWIIVGVDLDSWWVTIPCELQSVGHQIIYGLRGPYLVDAKRWQRVCHVNFRVGLFDCRLQTLKHFPDDHLAGNPLRGLLHALCARERQDVLQKLVHALRATYHPSEVVPTFFVNAVCISILDDLREVF